MARNPWRRRVASETARLMSAEGDPQYFRAKMKAARRIYRSVLGPGDLPNKREIRREIDALAELIEHENSHNGAQPKPNAQETENAVDCLRAYEVLLMPLEHVKEDPEAHPEGDVLYHSLQVFALAREHRPYDEEFLLAALLHDVGKAIDRRDHVAAALQALAGLMTPRTAWLIEHHVEALALREGTLGVRSRRRLEASEDFDDLLLLARCDALGRQKGVPVADVAEALEYIRQLSEQYDA